MTNNAIHTHLMITNAAIIMLLFVGCKRNALYDSNQRLSVERDPCGIGSNIIMKYELRTKCPSEIALYDNSLMNMSLIFVYRKADGSNLYFNMGGTDRPGERSGLYRWVHVSDTSPYTITITGRVVKARTDCSVNIDMGVWGVARNIEIPGVLFVTAFIYPAVIPAYDSAEWPLSNTATIRVCTASAP